jgi:methionine-gamma-lyase
MAVRPPIYLVSTYAFPTAEVAAHWFEVVLGKTPALTDETVGLIYARLNNPNAEMFEDALKSIDRGASAAIAFSSGMSAITTTLLTLARPGAVILYQRPVYGGTDHVFHHLLADWQVKSIAVREGEWERALEEHAKDVAVVYLETPANPTLRMIDLEAISALVRRITPDRHVPIVVDNTFLGPVFQSPLIHGADVAVYSATKFLGGHSDLVAGALTSNDVELAGRIRNTRAFLGTICEPFTAWMLQRSMTTLHVRMI